MRVPQSTALCSEAACSIATLPLRLSVYSHLHNQTLTYHQHLQTFQILCYFNHPLISYVMVVCVIQSLRSVSLVRFLNPLAISSASASPNFWISGLTPRFFSALQWIPSSLRMLMLHSLNPIPVTNFKSDMLLQFCSCFPLISNQQVLLAITSFNALSLYLNLYISRFSSAGQVCSILNFQRVLKFSKLSSSWVSIFLIQIYSPDICSKMEVGKFLKDSITEAVESPVILVVFSPFTTCSNQNSCCSNPMELCLFFISELSRYILAMILSYSFQIIWNFTIVFSVPFPFSCNFSLISLRFCLEEHFEWVAQHSHFSFQHMKVLSEQSIVVQTKEHSLFPAHLGKIGCMKQQQTWTFII